MNLSINYLLQKKYDSATYYNEKHQLLALKHNDSIMFGYAINVKGKIQYEEKKYKNASLLLKKSISYLIEDENYLALSSTYNAIAKSYNKLQDNNRSLKYFLKIDSLFLSTKNFYSNQKPAYKFLVNYYKEKKDNKKQLEYINKYITVDSVLNARSKSVNKSLTEKYDIPNLLAEKKLIENRLKGDLSTTKNWAIGVGALAFLLSLFLIYQTRKRKRYKKRFQLLVTEKESIKRNEKTILKKEINILPNEIIFQILAQLKTFEFNETYLSSDITLGSLAKEFNTNSKYLSQVINQQKKQSFNNYINGLRIKYTVEKLKTDVVFRKYSIKAIANEVGFNTTESFSKAFFKNTGIRPSFFIKELND
jgi:AraC-like DNA-binding protein